MHSRWFWGVAFGAILGGLLLTGHVAQQTHALKLKAIRSHDRAEAAARAACTKQESAGSALPIRVVSTSGSLNSGLHASTRPLPPPGFLSPTNVDEERLAAALKEKDIRLYPYPYSHVFSFCSDCDSCKIPDFIRYHELLNHRFGLDVGDSVFLFNQSSGRLGFFDAANLTFRGCASSLIITAAGSTFFTVFPRKARGSCRCFRQGRGWPPASPAASWRLPRPRSTPMRGPFAPSLRPARFTPSSWDSSCPICRPT